MASFFIEEINRTMLAKILAHTKDVVDHAVLRRLSDTRIVRFVVVYFFCTTTK